MGQMNFKMLKIAYWKCFTIICTFLIDLYRNHTNFEKEKLRYDSKKGPLYR